MRALALVALSATLAWTGDYVGSAACAGCHRAIADTQARTRMARTAEVEIPPAESSREGEIQYESVRKGQGIEFRVTMPGREAVSVPVERMVGGDHHGVSFLARIAAIEGARLQRPALVETRYLHSAPDKRLVLSPGFPDEHPASFETAFGRALSPQFETKCLACHGTSLSANDKPGVRCEHCHGPGRQHLLAVGRGKPKQGIVNPALLDNEGRLGTCAPCHSGFSRIADPQPDDLLISNQVNALSNSECYIQSGKGLSCSTCHDPHNDSTPVVAKANDACLSCHAQANARHAAVCPVNQTAACTTCHMPAVRKGSFDIVDHWIRVHPDASAVVKTRKPEWSSTVHPKREFLKIIATKDRETAVEARERLDRGEAFFDVAGKYSIDATAPGGGYLGEVWLDKIDPAIAAAASKLDYGCISPAVQTSNGFVIVARCDRNFKYRANQLQEEASALRRQGQLTAAIAKYLEALRVYPHLLRGLIFLGTAFGEQGNANRAAGVLEFAARLYPDDPAARYNLGIAYGSLGRTGDEIAAYRTAIELEPDLVPAYQNLGAALLASGQVDGAAEAYTNGLDVNPLSTVLYYNLALVRGQQGRAKEADTALETARAIDPEFVRKQEAARRP